MFQRSHFPFFKQLDSTDCGPSCLRMIAKYYGRNYSLAVLREKSYIDRAGVSMKGISEAAESIGFRTMAVKVPFSADVDEPSLLKAPLPAILHWNQNHFVVLYRLNKKYAWVADPALGKRKIEKKEFEKHWIADNLKGAALLLETTPDFNSSFHEKENKKGIGFLIKYLPPHRRLIVQLIIGLLLGTVFQIAFPFLTQSIVDIGIERQDLHFIYLVLFGQLALFVGQMFTQFIQSWIILHISTRVNVNLIADYLIRLMKLPMKFFDSRNVADLLQRISDHQRIESFLTESILDLLFAILSIVVFGIVLCIYSIPIFLVFLISTVLYVGWVLIFLNRRREIDYQRFQQASENQNQLIEIIQGISDIHIQGSALDKRWQWATTQAGLFRTQINALRISQYQDAGARGIAQIKDILITFIAAMAVLKGSITLGSMLAIQYIIGQLNIPLQMLLDFIRSWQDAGISLERLGEVHESADEENETMPRLNFVPGGDISLRHVSFSYTPISPLVLRDIHLTIPYGKTTAIVGASGSGKTTLVKLLLGFYPPNGGQIFVGDIMLNSIYPKIWRKECGVVLQDGFIFSESIMNNIAEGDHPPDLHRAIIASKKANLLPFIQSLPLGFNTMVGAKGNGLSQGQKQRLLIARALYKNAQFLFFDEATNALDASNEKIIMTHLHDILKGRTAVIVAHRLSTVRYADKIVVLSNGAIVEEGTHNDLVNQKGYYYTLVKDQLELGE